MNPFQNMVVATPEVAPYTVASHVYDIPREDGTAVTLSETNDWTLKVGTYDANRPTLTDFLHFARAIEDGRQDRFVRVDDIIPTDDGRRFGLQWGGQNYPMTDKGLGQVLGRLRTTFPAPIGDYIRAWGEVDRVFATAAIQRHFTQYLAQRGHEDRWLMRAFGDTARGALSAKYSTIGNLPVLNTINKCVTGQDLPDLSVAGNSFIGPDALRLDMVWRSVATPDGPYGLGVSFRNNHIGEGRFNGSLLLWRGKCHNSIVIDTDESEISIVHRGRSAQGVVVAAIPAMIEAAIEKSGYALKQVETSIETVIEVPDWSALFNAVLGNSTKLNEKETAAAIRGADSGRTDGRASAMSVVNGLTSAAHMTEGIGPDRAIELQKLAGDLLFSPVALAAKSVAVARRVEAAAA